MTEIFSNWPLLEFLQKITSSNADSDRSREQPSISSAPLLISAGALANLVGIYLDIRKSNVRTGSEKNPTIRSWSQSVPQQKQITVHDQLKESRAEKLAALRKLGVDPYPNMFLFTATATALDNLYKNLVAGEETNDSVTVAGRIRALRNSGMFIDLHDTTGKIQVFCHKDLLAPSSLAIVKLLDIGDLIGVSGTVRRTPRGELTINARVITVLAKAQEPFPDNY